MSVAGTWFAGVWSGDPANFLQDLIKNPLKLLSSR